MEISQKMSCSDLTSEPTFLSQVSEMGLGYLRISITKDCNAACKFCHNENQKIGARGNAAKKKPADLTLEDYAYIADHFRSTFSSVKFTGGEPTLASNLPEIINLFSTRGYECSMVSNGLLLDKPLQERLKSAGLSKVNVSIPTLDPAQYKQFFGIDPDLESLTNNLSYLKDNFGGFKINFMASDLNVPTQLPSLRNLSSKYGATISVMDLADSGSFERKMSERIEHHLGDTVGKVSEIEIGKGKIITYSDGSVWEFDDFRTKSSREKSLDNDVCRNCSSSSTCVEGPYALRVSHNGTLSPCLSRTDNQVNYINGRFE